MNPLQLVLLGMRPAYADSQLGYIMPAAGSAAARLTAAGAVPVAEFIEKPVLPLARQLIARGALWNAFIVAASAAALLRTYAQLLPGVLGAMREALADEQDPARALAALYERLPSVDFSRDLLCECAALPLRVLPVPLCGWSDLGTPECVARVLAHLPDLPRPLTAIPRAWRAREPGQQFSSGGADAMAYRARRHSSVTGGEQS